MTNGFFYRIVIKQFVIKQKKSFLKASQKFI